MKRNWWGSWTIVMMFGTVFASGRQSAATYFDDFESPTLNPFWTSTAISGSVGFGTAPVRSGSQSLQFTTNPPVSGNMDVQGRHNFGSAIYGSASIWVYDSAADQTSGNYIRFFLYNSALATRAELYTQDFDLGPSTGGHYYCDGFNGGGNTPVDRTQAWHLLQLTSLPNLLQLSIDGTIVHSGLVGTPFDSVVLETHAPGWRPGLTVNFDDFEVTAVPEPSTLTTLVICAALCAVANTCRCRFMNER